MKLNLKSILTYDDPSCQVLSKRSCKSIKQGWFYLARGGKPWDWFCTFTFNYDLSPEQAFRRFKRWLGRLNQALRDAGVRRPRVKYILATEWTHYGRVHLHCLISSPGLDRLNRLRWCHRWEKVGRGIARIYPARDKAGPYLAKDILKGGELQIGGTWPGRFCRSF